MKKWIIVIAGLFASVQAWSVSSGDYVQVKSGKFEGHVGTVVNTSSAGFVVAYPDKKNIPVLFKSGQLRDISEVDYYDALKMNYPVIWAEKQTKLSIKGHNADALFEKVEFSKQVTADLERRYEEAMEAEAQASNNVVEIYLEKYLDSASDYTKENIFRQVLAELSACKSMQ